MIDKGHRGISIVHESTRKETRKMKIETKKLYKRMESENNITRENVSGIKRSIILRLVILKTTENKFMNCNKYTEDILFEHFKDIIRSQLQDRALY